MSIIRNAFFYSLLLASNVLVADGWNYPKNSGDSLIGNNPLANQYTYAVEEETLLDVARTYDMGQNEILLANPGVDRWLPGSQAKIKVSIGYLLPDTDHDGIVLNLAEYRLYYFPKNEFGEKRKVFTHPISIGRVDWDTPLGDTTIIAKNKNPVWRPPQSIKDEHAAEGDILPDVFPAGPDNPLGLYALRLGVQGYLIHSTNKPYGVGMRVSHGCIRMYPEDIEKLFPEVKVGTKVNIINQAIKVGWSNNKLYLEIHPKLDAKNESYKEKLSEVLNLIVKKNNNKMPIINGKALRQAIKRSDGIPVSIAMRKLLPNVDANNRKNLLNDVKKEKIKFKDE
ncbi:MAG: L,D-transpeptidase family protein [Methylococcales bacterium]|nr:L,D-transpeptidase family protein [Methylococcales bacterium]